MTANVDFDAFKKLMEEHMKNQQPASGCPNCGYCPACGRGAPPWPRYPSYPGTPYVPPIWYLSGTNTSISTGGN